MSQGSDKPIDIEWGLLEKVVSEISMEKVGNLRDIAVLVQLNLAFLTFIDLHVTYPVKLSRIINLYFQMGVLTLK